MSLFMPFTKLGPKPSLFVSFVPVSSAHDGQPGMGGYLRVLLQPLPRAWFHFFTKGMRLLAPPKPNWANPEGLGRAGSHACWGDLSWPLTDTYLWPQIKSCDTFIVIHRQGRIDLPDTCVLSWGGQSLLVSVHSVSKRPLHSILNIFFFSFAYLCPLLLIFFYKVAQKHSAKVRCRGPQHT